MLSALPLVAAVGKNEYQNILIDAPIVVPISLPIIALFFYGFGIVMSEQNSGIGLRIVCIIFNLFFYNLFDPSFFKQL